MNHIYRSVWNEITRTYVAAAEIVRGKGKGSKSSRTAEDSEAALAAGSTLAGATGEHSPPLATGPGFGGFRFMALEQRFMFDGAAVADAVDTVHHSTDVAATDSSAHLLNLASTAIQTLPGELVAAEAQAEQLVADFLNQPDAKQQLFALFYGNEGGEPSAAWQAAFDQLMSEFRNGDSPVRVELRSNAELQGAKGAFSSIGTTGQATIYLNADWLAGNPSAGIDGADSTSISTVLVEELGHYLDATLNQGGDTAGDEGEIFSRYVIDGANPLSVAYLADQNDHITLQIDGQNVQAELASFSFARAYGMVYDLNNSGSIVGSTGETAAEKEQSSHNFDITSLGPASINPESVT